MAQLRLSLEEKLQTLKQLDGEILELTQEEHLDEEIEQADTYKDNIYSAIVRMDRLKDRPSSPSATAGAGATTAPAGDRGDQVKLPKLTMQPFSGDITTWTPFWDSYDSAIHQNSSLTAVSKFNYLRSLLKGTARDAVSGLTLTAANYTEAIEILKRRFGNKQQIISRHMEVLMNLESTPPHPNAKALRHFYDVVESNVRSLTSLGITTESYGRLLAPVVMNKLPNELQLLIGRKVGDDEWNLEVILRELLQEIEARERASSNTAPQARRPPKLPPTAATFLLDGTLIQCCFCNQQHASDKCEVVRGLEERCQVLKTLGRCFVCLRRGHISRECRSKKRCPSCRGKHHFSICFKATETTSRSTSGGSKPPESTPAQQTAAPQGAATTRTPTNTSLFVGVKEAVLLQTAKVQIFNPENPRRSLEVRAILDIGSQQSYVTQRVKNALSLNPHGQHTMSIMTFGSNQQNAQVCEVLRIGIVTQDGGQLEFDLFAVPSICQPLSAQPIDLCANAYQHLSDLDLADSSEAPTMEVDILIGSNYYWDLTTGETRRGQSGPVAIRTRLGWVLSGPVPTVEGQQLAASFLTTHVLRVDVAPHFAENLEETLHSFWNLESMGIRDAEDSVLENFTRTIQFKGDRYEVALPWKDAHSPLPDNIELSKKRLEGLLRRLKQDPDIMREYDGILQKPVARWNHRRGYFHSI